MSEEPERHSHALEPSLVSDPDEIARIEARNGVRQFDAVSEMIEHFSDLSAAAPISRVFARSGAFDLSSQTTSKCSPPMFIRHRQDLALVRRVPSCPGA